MDHTCSFEIRQEACLFHGDHQPPKAVAQQLNAQWFRFGTKVKFRFFPQCVNCSNVQGKILSTATNDLRGALLLERQAQSQTRRRRTAGILSWLEISTLSSGWSSHCRSDGSGCFESGRAGWKSQTILSHARTSTRLLSKCQ